MILLQRDRYGSVGIRAKMEEMGVGCIRGRDDGDGG
jgi:hypothetical protein